MMVEGMVQSEGLAKGARMAPLYLNPTVHCWARASAVQKVPDPQGCGSSGQPSTELLDEGS